MKAYSADLRERIIQAVEAREQTQSDIAQRFQVSLSFVENLIQRWRASGSYTAKPHGGGPPRQLQAHAERLRRAVQTQPDATLEELRERLVAADAPRVSLATVCRELQRLDLPLKKNRSARGSETRPVSKGCAARSATPFRRLRQRS